VGSYHDGLTSPEEYEQASEASPASRILHAATKSALAEKPHSTQTNFACVLRFSADTWPHSGQERLVFWGGTAINNPPRHNVLYSNWRRSSNGEASRIARFNPDFALTFFLADLLMLFTCKSSTTTTAWLLLMRSEPCVRNLFAHWRCWLYARTG
jgi:hypothetical protein